MLPQAADFRAEADALRDLLSTLSAADWDRATQFKRWTVNDICLLYTSLDPAQFEAARGEFGAEEAGEMRAALGPVEARTAEQALSWVGGICLLYTSRSRPPTCG